MVRNTWALLFLCFVLAQECLCDQWSSLTEDTALGIWSQRDVMSNITIDQVPVVGLDLGTSIFSGAVNNSNELMLLEKVLDSGVQAFIIDLTFNNSTNRWDVANTTHSLHTFVNVLERYLIRTNTNIHVNMWVLLLRFPEGAPTTADEHGQVAMLENELGGIGSFIYEVSDLRRENNVGSNVTTLSVGQLNWPTLHDFLYVRKKRVVVMLQDQELGNQTNRIFGSSVLHFTSGNSTAVCPFTTQSDLINQSGHSWRFLHADYETRGIKEYLRCGYSPIIRNRYNSGNISQLVPIIGAATYWSWDNHLPYLHEEDTQKGKPYAAHRCTLFRYNASSQSGSWVIADCNQKRPYICKSETSPYEWFKADQAGNHSTYFELGRFAPCPSNHTFSLPETPLQQRSLEKYLSDNSSPDIELWIDLNSVQILNCWVTGGPDTLCPYHKKPLGTFTEMMVPACILFAVFMVIIITLDLIRVPIQDNRRSWKRVINNYSKSETDGIPS
ncbi:HBL261Wp [Eremothecium sinecaudum]|uniref:Maintenance of telomere capping protein 6 n=1 Tax=Eremothecium sinecaudum TaxID=45286 RepID=A0A109UW28_9SACH|nr:HBL261Wp [Eremothecium sinecaudum]AMD18641.1 HBL261Wp [Eremothecium sinecaudum]